MAIMRKIMRCMNIIELSLILLKKNEKKALNDEEYDYCFMKNKMFEIRMSLMADTFCKVN